MESLTAIDSDDVVDGLQWLAESHQSRHLSYRFKFVGIDGPPFSHRLTFTAVPLIKVNPNVVGGVDTPPIVDAFTIQFRRDSVKDIKFDGPPNTHSLSVPIDWGDLSITSPFLGSVYIKPLTCSARLFGQRHYFGRIWNEGRGVPILEDISPPLSMKLYHDERISVTKSSLLSTYLLLPDLVSIIISYTIFPIKHP
jgi:hypothetical protein